MQDAQFVTVDQELDVLLDRLPWHRIPSRAEPNGPHPVHTSAYGPVTNTASPPSGHRLPRAGPPAETYPGGAAAANIPRLHLQLSKPPGRGSCRSRDPCISSSKACSAQCPPATDGSTTVEDPG